MNKLQKKITASIVLIAILTLVSGICYGTIVSAHSNQIPFETLSENIDSRVDEKNESVNIFNDIAELQIYTVSTVSDCIEGRLSQTTSTSKQLQNNAPIKDSIAPCCISKSDNDSSLVPFAVKDRVKISQDAMMKDEYKSVCFVEKKNYSSLSSPPSPPDILSSVIKKE